MDFLLGFELLELKEKRRGAAEIHINPSGLSALTHFRRKKLLAENAFRLACFSGGAEGRRVGTGSDALYLRQGVAGGANLGGQHFQHLERQQRASVHEADELAAGNEAELCAVAGNGRERAGLVADQ
jgi:hypothetical protein